MFTAEIQVIRTTKEVGSWERCTEAGRKSIECEPYVNPLIDTMRAKLKRQRLAFEELTADQGGVQYVIFRQVEGSTAPVKRNIGIAAQKKPKTTGIKSQPIGDGWNLLTHPSGYTSQATMAWDEKHYQKVMARTRREIASRMALGNYGLSYSDGKKHLPLTEDFMTLPA